LEGEVVASAIASGPSVPAIDASTRFNLGNGKLLAAGHLRTHSSAGVVDFSVAADVPRHILDAAAWKRVDPEQAVLGAQLIVRDVDLAAVAKLTGRPPTIAGRVDGSVTAEPHLSALDLSIDVRGLQASGDARNIDGHVGGRWDRSALSGTA